MIEKIFVGPVCSGKTTALWKEYEKSGESKKEYYQFTTNSFDVEKVMRRTHGGSAVYCTKIQSWNDIDVSLDGFFIDEVQFSNIDGLDGFLSSVRGKKVFMAGLNMDWRGEDFEMTKKLIDATRKVSILSAVCDLCGGLATKSKKIGGNKERLEEDAKYIPVCNVCFYI